MSGILSGVADAVVLVNNGLTGDGVLVGSEFSALNAGTSVFDLSSVFLDGLDSGFDIANGTVCVRASPQDCVGGNQAPPLGTLALLLVGLGAMCWRRRAERTVG